MHDLHTRVSKDWAVIIFADSDTSIGLWLSPMPRCSKVAFFVLTRRQAEPITLPLAHARGVLKCKPLSAEFATVYIRLTTRG